MRIVHGIAGSSLTAGSPNGSAIPIGVIGSYSGPEAAYLAGSDKTMEAWAASVNAAGGLNGHPVKLYVEDDQTNVATAVRLVKQLVQQDHVVAIVGQVSTGDSSWASYAQAAGVPVIGGDAIHTAYLTNPDFYGVGANLIAGFYGVASAAAAHGPRFGALYCAGLTACAAVVPILNGFGRSLNVRVTYSSKVAAGTPGFTAFCQGLKGSKVNSYDIALAQDLLTRVATECASQGLKAPLVSLKVVDATFASNPAYDQMSLIDSVFPFFDKSTPATKAFHAALRKYAPSVGASAASPLNPEVAESWASGKLFEAAVRASGSGPVTPASIKRGLYALRNETLGGLTGPLNFTPGKPSLENCYFTYKIAGGAFAEPAGLRPTCAPTALVDAVASALSRK
jgi:branched-chain amino acid transport system substrate-binding protein